MKQVLLLLAEALSIGKYLDKGVPMAVIQEAVRKAADLLPALEEDEVQGI